ncbi:toxin VasX, partial [Gilliamella sp. wkB18]
MTNLESLVSLILAAKIKQNDSGKRCPKCQEKEGDLIVLPTRLSISGFMGKNKTLKHNLKADVELPPLPDFAQQMVSNLPLEHSKYCIQMLRQGYLYVLVDYKSGEKKWRAFTSSPTGCLVEYNDINKVPNTPPTYSCNIATD